MDPVSVSVVVPTIGRESLQRTVDSLAAAHGPLPERILLVDDRLAGPLPVRIPARLAGRVTVLAGPGRGPAAARNTGWTAAASEWIAFLDDDVTVGPHWHDELAADLAQAGQAVAGVQGRLHVPMPADRAPTDWERSVAGLETAQWATADMAYRRSALAETGGFDERFTIAYREDADLALRIMDRGHILKLGARHTTHPVRPAPWWISLRTQAGNSFDPLMDRLHGPGWRERAGVPRGRRTRHLAITLAGCAGLAAAATGHRRLAAAALAGWAAGTAEFAAARIAPGPRTPAELAAMALTSAVLPPVAVAQWIRGMVRYRGSA
ncbi:MAG: hypothetical protein QOD41_685 [Cryptosporangiaceae bacterium]|nr:hypothetical protein [Cryptosporangiaceae bacterium]